MKLKLSYFENHFLRIEQNENGLTFEQKDPYIKDIKVEIDFAVSIMKYINAALNEINQPERSKREDIEKCEECKSNIHQILMNSCNCLYRYLDFSLMRCSEHCGNTVRDK